MKEIELGNKKVQVALISQNKRYGLLFRDVYVNTKPKITSLQDNDTIIWFNDLESIAHVNLLVQALISKCAKTIEII